MLLIPNNKLLTKELLNEASVSGYPNDIEHVSAINNADRLQMLKELDERIKNEQFSFSINIRKNAITHCTGVKRWLGYSDNQFSIKNYLYIMHPVHAIVQGFYAVAMFDFLSKEAISLTEMMQLTFVSLLALKHKNGHFIYCKNESRPLLLTKDVQIIEYTNEFTVVKTFINEHYSFRIYDITGHKPDLEEKIKASVKYYFEKQSGFSVQELRILRRYAALKDITSEKIAKSFKIEKSTVATYNKRILNKAENIFEYRFANAQQVAEFVNDMNLI
jgi:hypothetical protein